MKKLALAVFALALMTSGFGEKALATCTIVGIVVATEADDDSVVSGTNTVIVREFALDDHTFSFTTVDQDIMLVAVIAKSSQIAVAVTGDEISCPAAVPEADNFGGQVLNFDLNT